MTGVAVDKDTTTAMSGLPAEPDSQTTPRNARRRVWAIVLAAAGLLALVLVVAGVVGTSDAGCTACHAAEAKAFLASAHADLPCTTCHAASPNQVSARVGVLSRMVPSSLGGVELDGPGRPVGSGACVACHADVLAEEEIVTKNGLRIDHSACAAGTSCSSCHSYASHGTSTRIVRAPSMADCTDCHLDNGISVECALCHEGEMPKDRVRDAVWVRTHGPDWKEAHGLGDLRTCAVCHPPDDCTECHGTGVPHPADFGANHGKYALDSGQDMCLTCHEDSSWCEGCHQVDMPHPEGFLQAHSSVAVTQEDPACTTCHPAEDCRSCHAYHAHPGGSQPPVGKYGEG